MSHGSNLSSQHLDLLLPDGRVGLRQANLVVKTLEQELEQLVLVAYMPVQRGGAGTQLLGDAAHGKAVDAILFEYARRGVENALAGDGHAGDGCGAISAPGWLRNASHRRQVGPSNIVRHSNTC